METFWLVIFSVVVAAFIGGLTNYLAIKMLFHPRRTIYLGSLRMPFTPGIIPKRRDEIAVSLGKIVSEHLVTQDSIRNVITQHETQSQLETYLMDALVQLKASELSVGDWLYSNFGTSGESFEDWKERFQLSIQKAVQTGTLSVWKGIGSKPIKELLPEQMVDRQHEYAAKLAAWILEEAEDYLRSPEGQHWLEGILNNILSQTSGLKGFFAGFFMGDPRMANQISIWLVNGIRAPELRMKLQDMIRLRISAGIELTAEEGLQFLDSMDEQRTGPVIQEISAWLSERLVNDNLLSSLLQMKLGAGVSYFEPQWRMGVPRWSKQLIGFAEKQLPVVLKRIDLPGLVQQRVSAFPVEQVERIILEVSGREFRAITWLGALLGGMIGLVQSLFYLYVL